MKYTHILKPNKTQKDFYLIAIKNLLRLFNETNKNDKNSVLSVLSDILSKRIFKKESVIFSNTMYRTSKRKHFSIEKENEAVVQTTKKQRNQK